MMTKVKPARRSAKAASATSTALIRLKLDGEVTLQRLNHALDAWTDFLREVGRDVSGVDSREPVRFVIAAAKAGSMTIGVTPQPTSRAVSPATLPRIAKAVTAGLKMLERSPKRPKHFSDAALERLRDLGSPRGSDVQQRVLVGNGVGDPQALSRRMMEHVDAVLAPEIESIGTVEGVLEGLIIHGKRRFLIFDQITGRQVTCYFTERIGWEQVYRHFGKRAAATGALRSRRSGDAVSMSVHRLHVFQDDDELPTAEQVRGLLKAVR